MLPGPGKALLFDIDGTLADTDVLHLEARPLHQRASGFFKRVDR